MKLPAHLLHIDGALQGAADAAQHSTILCGAALRIRPFRGNRECQEACLKSPLCLWSTSGLQPDIFWMRKMLFEVHPGGLGKPHDEALS